MRWAQIENDRVVNIVIADDAWVQSQTDTFISIGDSFVEIGGSYENGVYIHLQPYPSWVREGSGWVAPVVKPDGVHAWNESTLSWVALDG